MLAKIIEKLQKKVVSVEVHFADGTTKKLKSGIVIAKDGIEKGKQNFFFAHFGLSKAGTLESALAMIDAVQDEFFEGRK